MGPDDSPTSVPATAGLPRSRLAETIVAPFNQADTVAAILEANRDEIAAIIVEPVQFNIGVAPPLPGFLERLRELATEHGIVLIFDEVKTGVVLVLRRRHRVLRRPTRPHLPGQEHRRRRADRRLRRPRGGHARRSSRCRSGTPRASALEHSTLSGGATRVAHLGTFNGNPLSVTAGLVTLTKVLTPDVYPRLHAMADRLTAGCQEVLDEFGLPGYAINVGPKGCVMFTPERVTNYRDFIGLDGELWEASFFYLANRGVLLPPGPDDQWTLSVQHSDEEIERHVAVFRDFAQEVAGCLR